MCFVHCKRTVRCLQDDQAVRGTDEAREDIFVDALTKHPIV